MRREAERTIQGPEVPRIRYRSSARREHNGLGDRTVSRLGGDVDKSELAIFLRRSRERIDPSTVGLPAGPRRRTPGLRREEVAQLAFISVEYYTRLEQARGPHPSPEVLAGIVRALRLNDAESAHLHNLAGVLRRGRPFVRRDVSPSIQLLLDRLPQSAAFVMSADLEVLAWNHLASAVMGDLSELSPGDRNLARWWFLDSRITDAPLYEISDADGFARSTVADLRRAHARYPDDATLTALIADLRAGSDEFADLWAAADLHVTSTTRKTLHHRLVGTITVTCDALDITDRDQRVIIYTADPGSPSDEAMGLLRVIGTQALDLNT